MTRPPPEHSTRFGRARDARLVWLLSTHPVTANLLVEIGLFPSPPLARRRLRRLVARRRVRAVGTVSEGDGRAERVFARWRPKPDLLAHEVALTRFCVRLHAARIERGPPLSRHPQRPDAVAEINGATYLIELDRGTMSPTQMAGRFRWYADCPHLSLWVCRSKERAERLRAVAGPARGSALFAAVGPTADPHAVVWWDADGRTTTLPRDGDGRRPLPGPEGPPSGPPACGGPVPPLPSV